MKLRATLALCLLISGASLLLYAVAQPAKAWLGQALISRAYAAGDVGPPWPWADFRPYARIDAPRLEVSLVALSSASGEAMAWGPGRIEGSAEPGQPGTVAFAGHRDSHFAFLGDLRIGEEVTVERQGSPPLSYRVSDHLIVDSRSWRLPVHGRERIALTTCWPIDAMVQGPLRLVVLADRQPD